MTETWNQAQALDLCRKIEEIAPAHGCHVALTGGCLYKQGERKDVDVLLYRIRQVEKIDTESLFVALSGIGLVVVGGFGWVFKAKYQGKTVDLFFPEEIGGNYEESQ